LEAGNFDADDSDIKQRYDNQRQVPMKKKKRFTSSPTVGQIS
jgi:hypothetical protein